LSGLILISGLFYLYPDAPDVKGFIALQHPQLILLSDTYRPKQHASVSKTEKRTQRVQEYLFQPGMQSIDLDEDVSLKYAAINKEEEKVEVFVLLANGTLYQILPQNGAEFENGNLMLSP